jgi:prepilin peptidase CpaA
VKGYGSETKMIRLGVGYILDIQLCFVSFIIITAFCIDIRSRKIPNWLTVCGLIGGMSLNLIWHGKDGVLFSICGLLVGLCSLLGLYFLGALGAGDVKLFAAIGAITGTDFVFNNMLYAIVYAGIIGCLILIGRKLFKSRIAWLISILFSLFLLKEWRLLSTLPKDQMIRFPFMWAVLPALVTNVIKLKGI